MSNPAVIHSTLSFSSRKRWKNCPDSVPLSVGLPDKESPAAREGTAAHAVAEFYVAQAWQLPGWQPGEAPAVAVPEGVDLKGRTPEEWNDELRKHGRAYVDYIRSLIPAGTEAFVTLEQKVSIPKIHPKLFGTADCIVWLPALATVIVIDYKYGFEDVACGDVGETNEQLASYAVATVDTFNLPVEQIVVAIYQPRRIIGLAGQSLTLPADWLTHERARLVVEVMDVEAANGTKPNPGSWCRYCRAKPVCPRTHEALAGAVAVYAGEKNVHSMSDDEVVQLWAARTAFKGVWEDIEERIGNLAKMGHPRIQVELGTARRKWKDETTATLTLLAMGRHDLLVPKALGAVYDRLPDFTRADLVTLGAPPKSLKLVDPGTPSQVAKIFKKYSNTVDAQVKGD